MVDRHPEDCTACLGKIGITHEYMPPGKYVATINVPGYLPMADEPEVFDTAQEAWEYLADERQRGEDDYEGEEYSEVYYHLENLAKDYRPDATPEWLVTWGINADGTGTVYGSTPGYEGSHDLGLAYSVSLAIECEHDMSREKVTCGACGRSWCDKCVPTHGPRCPYEYDHPEGING